MATSSKRNHQPYEEVVKAQAEPSQQAQQATVASVTEAHPDSGQSWHGQPTTPRTRDVPGWWLRNPRTGTLHFLPAKMEDAFRQHIRNGYRLEEDPRVSGAPTFGEPWLPPDQLA